MPLEVSDLMPLENSWENEQEKKYTSECTAQAA